VGGLSWLAHFHFKGHPMAGFSIEETADCFILRRGDEEIRGLVGALERVLSLMQTANISLFLLFIT